MEHDLLAKPRRRERIATGILLILLIGGFLAFFGLKLALHQGWITPAQDPSTLQTTFSYDQRKQDIGAVTALIGATLFAGFVLGITRGMKLFHPLPLWHHKARNVGNWTVVDTAKPFLLICFGAVCMQLYRVVVQITGASPDSAIHWMLSEQAVGLALVVVGALLLVGYVWLILRARGGSWATIGMRPNYSATLMGAQAWVIAFPALFLLNLTAFYSIPALMQSFGYEYTAGPQMAITRLLEQTESPTFFYTWVFYAVIGAPIVEEILFRGLIQGTLKRFVNWQVAVTISAFLFMQIHMDLIRGPSLFVLGLLLGYLRERTRSLWAPIAAHAANNLFSVAILLLGVV